MVGEPGSSTALSACRGHPPDLLHERRKRGVTGKISCEEVGGKLRVRQLKESLEHPARGGTRGDPPAARVTLQQHVKLLHAAPAAPQEAPRVDAGRIAQRHE